MAIRAFYFKSDLEKLWDLNQGIYMHFLQVPPKWYNLHPKGLKQITQVHQDPPPLDHDWRNGPACHPFDD